MNASLSWTDWSFEPTVTLGLVALAAGYALALHRGRISAGDDVSPWLSRESLRPLLFVAGIVTAYIALQSPIDRGGDSYLLTLHMVQHLLLMMVAPPLVLLGIAGIRPPAPQAHARLRAIWTWLTRPWQATLLFNAVLLVWHVPSLYDATLRTEWIHVVEHLTFIAVGVVFWWPIIDPVRGPRTVTVGPFSKIAMLVLAGVPPTVLGFVFAMAPAAFYDFYATAPRLWGLSPTQDQAAAGVVMLGLGNLVYFAAISVIFVRLFGNPAADEAEAERTLAPAAGRPPAVG